MKTELEFIGREDEIRQLSKIINAQEPLAVVCIQGEGGVGKTRLGLEFPEKYKTAKTKIPVKFLPVIDLTANLNYRFSIQNAIAEKISKSFFKEYYRIQSDYFRLQQIDVSSETFQDTFDKMQKAFIEEFNSYSLQHFVVGYIDTIDDPYIYNKNLEIFYLNILPNLTNAVFIFTGREAHKISYFSSIKIDLKPFTEDERTEFLKELPRDLPYKERLSILSEGKPLIMGLILIYYEKKIGLPETVSISDSDWEIKQKSPKDHFEEFKMELMKPFKQLLLPYASILEEMAVYERRYNSEILYFLHNNETLYPNIDEKFILKERRQAEEIIKQISAYFFIKPINDYFILHDEVKRLVQNYIIEKFGYTGDTKKEMLTKILKYYDFKIEDLNAKITVLKKQDNKENEYQIEEIKQELFPLKLDRAFYLLQVDINEAIRWITKEFGTAMYGSQKELENEFAELLIQNLNKTTNLDLRNEANIQIGKWHRKNYRLDEAENIYRTLLGNEIKTNSKMRVFIHLAELLRDTNKHEEAFTFLNQAETLGKDSNSFHLARIYENIGLFYDDKGELEMAVEYFTKSVEIADRYKENEFNLFEVIAAAKNERGYTLSRLGRYGEAVQDCETALAIREGINQSKFRIALSYNTLGEINSDKGKFEKAYEDYGHAKKLFEEIENKEWQAISLIGLGKAQRKEYEEKYLAKHKVKDEVLLKESKKNLEKARNLCEKFNKKYLATAIHEYAHIEFELKNIKEARVLWNISLKIAIDENNKILIINNINGLCECDFLEDKKEQILKYREIYDEVLIKELPNSFKRYFGDWTKLEGYIYLEQKNLEKAIEKLGLAIVLLAITRSWGHNRLENELDAFNEYFNKQKVLQPYLIEQDFYKNLQTECSIHSKKYLDEIGARKLNDIFINHLLLLSLKKQTIQ